MNPNKIFPILCQDDFFDNPDEIREYALSLDYKSDENGHWPGVRTRPLHEINPKLSTEVLVKVFSNYFDFDTSCAVNWKESNVCFQKVKPYNKNLKSAENKGWIHSDSASFAGLIYLTPEANMISGTSLYDLKKDYKDIDTQKFKDNIKELCKFYKGEEYNSVKLNEDYNDLEKHFDKSVEIKNVYNRMISYDGNNWHSAGDFVDEERLTLVFFVDNILSTLGPYQRSAKHDLKIRSMV